MYLKKISLLFILYIIISVLKSRISLNFSIYPVIYKRVVAKKNKKKKKQSPTRRFSFISFIEIYKINVRTEYPNRLPGVYPVGGKWLLLSGLIVLLGDALSNGRRFNCSCDFRLPYL